MKIRPLTLTLPLLLAAPAFAAPAPGVPAFYGDPPDANHPWGVHDRNRPQPKRVERGCEKPQEIKWLQAGKSP